MNIDMRLLEKVRKGIEKQAFTPLTPEAQAAASGAPPVPPIPPMDPAMMGGMPPSGPPPGMDPAMMGMPPGGPPPGMDPAMMGGMPPGMDPAMMGGMPPPPPGGMMVDPAMMGGMPPPAAGPPMPVTLDLNDLKAVLSESQGGSQNSSPRVTNEDLAARIDEMGQMLAMLMQALQIAPPAPGPAPMAGPAGVAPGPEELAMAAGGPPPGVPKTASARNHIARQIRKLKGV